jgi:APA family basic amino acid/polyamine antiporter
MDYKKHVYLQRRLGLFPATNIVVANMIGAGIFTTTGLLMADLNNPLLLLILWVVGGVIALSGALSYGAVGAVIPEAGGEYVFLSRMYHPLLGFLSGWISFIVGFSAPIAASAIGFSAYFHRAFPALFEVDGFSLDFMKKFYSVLVILVFTGIHLRGIDFGAKVQNVLTILKVALVVGLIMLGFSIGEGNMEHLFQGEPFMFDLGGWKTVGLSLMWIMFAYSGWNASVYIGSEIRNPEKNIPGSLFLGTGMVVVLYFLLNLLFIYAIPSNEMKDVISVGGLAAGNLFGVFTGRFFSMMIAFALFSSISAFIILGPRVYYAMARDGYFFSFASKVHRKYGVPWLSIIFQGLISIAILLSGTFDQILTYMGFSLGIFPLLVVFGLIRMRNRGVIKKSLPGYPFTAILYIAAGLGMMVLSLLERPGESGVALLTVALGIPAFYMFRKYVKRPDSIQ